MGTPTALKVWLMLGLISAVWFIGVEDEPTDRTDAFYTYSRLMLQCMTIWPYMIYKALNPESKTPLVP